MTETIESVKRTDTVLDEDAQRGLVAQMVEQARAAGIDPVGPGGLLTGLTKQALEAALEEELSEHLGYDKHDPVGRNGENSRNGARAKTVLTEVGSVEIEVPRDRDGTFDPVIVRKRQRRLEGVDQIVLSLTARGLTTGQVAAHFADVYGSSVSKDTISRITDKATGEMTDWATRPLDRVYPVLFIDAIVVKVRDGQVTNRPFYVVVGVTTAGERDILGIWAGDGSQGAKYWLAVLTEIKNRGVQDVCIVVCDGLKGLPESITTTWELAQVQTCVIHLIRNTFRDAARQDWDAMAKDLRPVYIHRGQRRAGPGQDGRLRRTLGRQVPRGGQALALGLGRVHHVPGLRGRDPQGHLPRPTRSSPSTRGIGARSGPGATSPTRPPP